MEAAKLAEPAEPAAPARAPWPLWHRILFRFASIYLVLNALPFPLGWLPKTEWVGDLLWTRPTAALAEWVGRDVYGMTQDVTAKLNGSGDQANSYVLTSLFLIAAAMASAIWSVVDRRRRRYDLAHAWVRVYLRYALAGILIGYGMAKVFKSQFPQPSLGTMMQTYGESSPMRLLWTFMGHSTAYTVFTGLVETGAALLLLFRRTTLLGALLGAGAMVHVAVMNFAYDVPVKIFSTHLVLMAVYLITPDLRRLIGFFLGRAAAPADPGPPLFLRRRLHLAGRVAKAIAVLAIVGLTTYGAVESWRKWGDGRPHPALYGVYEVETFARDGAPILPLLTEGKRWRWVIFDRNNMIVVVRIDGTRAWFRIDSNDGTTLQVIGPPDWKAPVPVALGRPDPDHLVLDGRFDGETLAVTTRRLDPTKLLLTNRGFHWVNDVPFNR